MKDSILFTPTRLGRHELRNQVVLPPLTRLNTVRMHRRLLAAQVQAELHVFEAMPHGGFGGAPEDREASGEVARFVGARLR